VSRQQVDGVAISTSTGMDAGPVRKSTGDNIGFGGMRSASREVGYD